MLRISEPSSLEGARLRRLEGRLIRPWVELVRNIVQQDQAQQPAIPLVLDLSGLAHAGPEGIQLLRQLHSAGVQLRACPAYLRDLCEMDCREM